MNIKWIIIGTLAVMLMIAFGRNPVEEARQNREALKKGKDPLIEAITEHNTKNPRRSVGSNFNSRIGNSGPEGEFQPTTPHMMRRDYRPPAGVPNLPQQQAPQTPQPPQNNYYPPPPLSGAPDPMAPAMAALKHNDKSRYLTTGQPVAFSGTRIYTYDAEGNPIPMPDGVYSMYDDRVHILVEGGRHVLSSN